MSGLDDATVNAAADELMRAHAERQPFAPQPEAIRGADLRDAYRIQAEFVRRLQRDGGVGESVGYKVALTSKAMQAMVGVNEPLSGVVFESRVHASPASLSLGDFQHMGLEFEVAVRMGASLDATGAPHDVNSVAPCVEAIAAAYEMVEDRHADYSTLEVFSLTADNAWNGGAVIGQWLTDWQSVDLEDGATRAFVDGELAGEGRTGDALGHPLAAVAWLANMLIERGETLPAGAVVLTGSSITTKFPIPGQEVRFEVDGLPSIQVRFST